MTGTLAGEPPTNMTYEIYPLLAAGRRRRLIDATTNKAVFNSPEGSRRRSSGTSTASTRTKISVPGVLSNGEKEKRANFASGNVAMMFEGPWGIAIQKQLNPNLNYDIAPLPAGKTTGTMVRGSLNTLTSQAPGQGSGLGLHALDVGAEGHRDVGEGNRRLPGADGCANQDWFKERKLFQAFVTQMSLPNAQSPFLVMPNAVQMNKIMTTEVQNAVQGKKTRQAGAR